MWSFWEIVTDFQISQLSGLFKVFRSQNIFFITFFKGIKMLLGFELPKQNKKEKGSWVFVLFSYFLEACIDKTIHVNQEPDPTATTSTISHEETKDLRTRMKTLHPMATSRRMERKLHNQAKIWQVTSLLVWWIFWFTAR